MSYIFDTNMFMEDFDVNKYKGEKIYIPIVVLEELDKHSHSSDKLRAYKARNGLKAIEKLGQVNYGFNGIEENVVSSFLDMSVKDNLIIEAAHLICKKDPDATLLTHDLNMYQKCVALGVKCKHIDYSKTPIYKGYIEVVGTTETINRFFDEINTDNLYPNEYILIKDISTDEETEMRWTGEKFVALNLPDSKVVKAKNALQRCALDLMMNRDITAVAILGGYGSGKTYLCMQMAHYFVFDKKEHNKILGIREPNGEGKDIGYLKGTFEDKTARFFRPIEQQLKGPGEYDYLIQSGVIETEIPFYMKGTTYDKTIFVVDEAEDLSEAQIRLVGTRVGENSRIFFSGDFAQSVKDKTVSNPLVKMCEQLKGNKKFGCVYLDEDVRSETSKMFADLFNN